MSECRDTGLTWCELPGGARLRLLEIDDAEELHSLIEVNREHLSLWMPWAGQSFDETVEFADRARHQLESNEGFQSAILRQDRIVGMVGYHRVDWQNRSTSIGYWLAAAEQGKGTMTEAVRALLEHAFSVWRLNRVEIEVAIGNVRSRAIPTRLGFREEGIRREAERVGDRYLDCVVYSALAAEWLSDSPTRRR